MNLWRIQNLLTKVPNIIRRSQTRKVLQENWVTRVFHQHQSLRDLRQAPIAGVLWPSDSVTNEFRCALRSVPSHNLVNLTTYTGDVGKTAGFLRCPSTFRIDSGQNSRLPSASQPVAGFYWQPCKPWPCSRQDVNFATLSERKCCNFLPCSRLDEALPYSKQ